MTSMNNSSDRSSSLFSPLPSHQSTPGQSYTPTPSQHTLTASQDPTPLTISAHDIDGGSKDFTEYTNLDISSLNSTKTSTNKENALTTPKTTPTVSIRVRVSAKKLREIQSPYDSSSSSLEGKSPLLHSMIEPGRHSFQPTHPHTSQASPLLVGGGQERAEERTALTPQRERIIQRKVNLIGNTDQDTQAGTKKVSLRQGVLQTRPDSTDPQDISSDSVLIQNEVSTEQCTAQASRDKLLYWKSQDVGTSRAKAVYHVQPVGLPDSQKSHVVISDVVQAADQKIKMSENQNRLREDGQFRFHEETAKLVATCTAAATAALLGTHQNPVKLMGRPSGSKVQSPPGQAASDVTSHEPERLSPTPIDQTDYVKTNGAQNHTNWAHSQNNQDVRSKPTRNNAFFTNRPNNITPLGSHYRARPPSSPGRTAQEWRDTPPQYSDLVTRVNRMEELQHSRLLTMDKVVMDTDKPLFKDNHANRNPVFKDNHANRNPCPGKRVFSLVKNEYCQTSPLGGLPLTKLSAPLAHISTPSIGIDVDTEGATEESGASFTGMSVRNSKENTRLPSSSTHLSHMPVTRPLLHDPPQSVRLEEDGVWSVAKVLSDVQQARADIDLQCALTEAQEQYTDLGELLQSMEYSEEFRDVSYKVAQLLESARTNQETAVTSRDLHVEMPKAMSVTRVKPDAMGRQRKEAIKTGRAHKVSNQETRQKPIATGKMTSIKPRVSARVTTPKLRSSQIKKTSYHHPLKKVSFTTSTAPHADIPTTAPHPNAPATSTASHPHAPTTSATPHSHSSVPTQLNQRPVVIPIGPPCVIPSPIYTLHDPLHSSRPPTQCDKFTSTHAPPHGADTKKSVVTTADACLQTSLSHDTEETGSSALDELLMKEQGVVDVSKMDNTVEDISNESSGGLEESREENLQAVDPSELSSTGSVESALTILGQHPPTPPPSQPPPPRPSHHTQCVRECASEELNEQLQERLESRAVEWLRQELTMRMLSQMKPLGDSGSNTPSISNSCSTCSIDSLNKLTDAAKLAPSYTGPEDNTVVFSAVKEAIRLELLSFAREMTGAMETIPATEQRAAEDTDDQYSYTPPESFTSSLSDRDSLSTPHPTPPLSISPTPDDTLTCEGVGLISTPPLTPPHNESRPHSPTIALQTPQVSADEESSVSESVHKTISVFSDRTVTTPQATPIPPPISVGSPPRSLTEPVTPLTQQHTKELNTSEDTSTTSNDISSTPSHDHTLTSSTSSTDRAISMGECIQTKFHLPHANSSLSEGEVPLSPGDIRWGALFSKVDPTVEAFLELKHSGDSFSGSEDTCHSQSQEFSVGEVGRTKVICVGPFEKFLTNINTSTPDDSSSCTREGSSVENTLSELTSINLDPLAPDITPILTQVRRHKPAGKNKGSPGEVLSLRTKDKRENSSISFPHSEGEVPKRLKARKNRPHVIETSQFDVSVDNTNEIRNGIDVISLSRLSSSKLQDKEESRLDDDTLQSISQISVKSSPVEAGMPKLLLVQPTYAHKEEQATGNEMPSVTYSDRQPSPKTLTFSSSEDLHMQNINLSELELTDTVSKQDNKEAVEAPTPPLPSPHRTTINVTVPVASEELTDFRSSDSYSSDFDFTSSVSIPGID